MISRRSFQSRALSVLGYILICAFTVFDLQAQKVDLSDRSDGLAHLQEIEKARGPHFVSRLSSGGASAFRAAKMLSAPGLRPAIQQRRVQPSATDAMAIARARLLGAPQASRDRGEQQPEFPVPVNDSSLDYDSTRFTGFTQSETSSAWCGDTIVAGFNDSSAWGHTRLLHQAESISLSGVAVSHNRGESFVGFPFLNPGPAVNPGSPFFDSELSGDPSVVCSDSLHFAYASIQIQIPVDSQGNVIASFTGMAVNRSSNGGLSWDDPIVAVRKDMDTHFLDKEWLAIDPHNSKNLYLTYTDFQQPGTEPGCPPGQPGIDPGPDVSLELVSSKDGGQTWNPPVMFARQCGLNLVQNFSGTQVVVGRDGQIFVAYVSVDGKNAEMRFRRSDDGGLSFGPEIIVGEAKTVSSLGFDHLQGNFRTTAFPSLAVDNSSGPNRGRLYMVWTDATRPAIPDLLATSLGFDDGYSFGDIVLSASSDGGGTWSAPKLVSPAPGKFQGAGRDQFMAGLAVDPSGGLAICYSDRRNDPNNFLIDHYCSVSHDGGTSFRDTRETSVSWTPTELTDGVINPAYMGDYDTVSSDFTGANAGFFSTFQIQKNLNPDVFGMRLRIAGVARESRDQ